ncbi:MAG TPA: hypothetical protein VFH37_01635 [Candidatus Saccharimonadales bacterium]|nr:hypothetical protein [Candidatus Saccharimonadales bacterium]
MDLERIKKNKDSILSVPRAVGGLCLTELGLFFIQEGHSIGDDILATPAIAVGFYMAAKGTINLLETAGIGKEESPDSHQQ